MHYTGLTFRPPYEARSILLQATTGCSHNKCTFYTMYKNTPFCVSPMEEIQADIIEAADYYPFAERVFLLNGDAFVLPAANLIEIANLIHNYLPNVRSIGSYATIRSIQNKSDSELEKLAELGYRDLNIGVESGLDSVLQFMNKGYNRAEAIKQLQRLNQAGLKFNLNIINAAAGPERISEHAQANASLVNEVSPTLIFVSPLHVDPGSELENIVNAGQFAESTLGEYITEEITFLDALEVTHCRFFGLHVSNPVPVDGWLPQDKDQLIAQLKIGMQRIPEHILNSHPSKGAEGRIIS